VKNVGVWGASAGGPLVALGGTSGSEGVEGERGILVNSQLACRRICAMWFGHRTDLLKFVFGGGGG